MKASDYIVEYLIEKKVTDVFGYPGGMVTHLMDSFSKYQDKIKAHVTYHEQGAAFAACGYAQASGNIGIAYATSGPGATNLITGICDAYMDSIPTLFITGQVNSFEQKGDLKVRQRGFQETDIVSMVSGVTKYAVQVNSADKLKWYLDYAFYIANEGRKGPVLLDIAMDVTRAEIDPQKLEGFEARTEKKELCEKDLTTVSQLIKQASRPVFVLGNGLLRNTQDNAWIDKLNSLGIPVVSSMLAVELKAQIHNFYGFIGAYGDRAANFVVAKSDLVISVGARLDVRQVGAKREMFAPNSKIIRIDIDAGELEYKVHEDEYGFCADAVKAISDIADIYSQYAVDYSEWIHICNTIEQKLHGLDEKLSNQLVSAISARIPADVIVTTDVGQNQVWVAQSFAAKKGQKILFSGGHGAMGYSLPAAIGACIATGKTVYSFNGDGGLQMNIQELQVIAREKLPVKVIVFNNHALGMIRHFQEMYFQNNYFQTVSQGGYTVLDFEKLAHTFGVEYGLLERIDNVEKQARLLQDNAPALLEVRLYENTYVFPKLEYGKPNQDQEPLLDRTLYENLMNLGEKIKMINQNNIDNFKNGGGWKAK